MCDDLKTEMASLAKKGVKCSKVEEARWGSVTKMPLPSGGKVGLYQPKHPCSNSFEMKRLTNEDSIETMSSLAT